MLKNYSSRYKISFFYFQLTNLSLFNDFFRTFIFQELNNLVQLRLETIAVDFQF